MYLVIKIKNKLILQFKALYYIRCKSCTNTILAAAFWFDKSDKALINLVYYISGIISDLDGCRIRPMFYNKWIELKKKDKPELTAYFAEVTDSKWKDLDLMNLK